jgi:hypothetical protein
MDFETGNVNNKLLILLFFEIDYVNYYFAIDFDIVFQTYSLS